ncbi:MAG: hypothetical protein H7Y02_12340 [Candidatus Obscuribacterales bacterium]|nr:hypothetical protein [Steroidobacteraceae bacterium]
MAALTESTIAEIAPQPVGNIAFTQTISRELAHKRRLENVYITSVSQVSNNQFVCGAFVPLANMYLNEMRAAPGDMALTIIEIGRQAGIAICHQYLGVPSTHAFVLHDVRFTATAAYAAADWTTDDMLAVKTTVVDHASSEHGTRTTLCGESEFVLGDKCIGRLSVTGIIQSAERYQRLRKLTLTRRLRSDKSLPQPEPQQIGLWLQTIFPAKRPVLGEVLWMNHGGSVFTTTLQVDRTNRFFFDHENDHVPGMLILEGLRELAHDVALRFNRPPARHAVPRAPVGDISISFKSFAELDQPVELVAHVKPNLAAKGQSLVIELHARQGIDVVAQAVAVVDWVIQGAQ